MPEYHSPQQQPGNEKRLLLVFAVTFAALLLFQPLLKKFVSPASENKPAQTASQGSTPATPAPAPAAAATAATPASSPQPGSKQDTAEKESVIENDLYRIVFTNKGAQVKSWVLKKYSNDQGKPQELVHEMAAQQFGYPMSLWTYDEALRNKLNSALYVPSATGTQSAPAQVVFEFSDGDVVVRKSFAFDHSYVVKIESSVTRNGQPVPAFPAWPSGFGDMTAPPSYAAARIDYQAGDKVTRLTADKKGQAIAGGNTIRTPFYWAGAVGQYFAAVFLPDQPTSASLVTLRNPIQVPKDLNKPDPNKTQTVEVLGAAVGNASGPTSARVFVGPKALDVIEKIKATPLPGQTDAPNLGSLVNFGFFGVIAKPLFLWLKWTQHHMIPNWGWAIAFLTLIINLALLPLRITQMKSSLKMQRLQPVVKNMQDRYKEKMRKLDRTDPRKRELQAEMNQEMMKIYKQNNVNPAGGCLPLIIQMPFLFAFYTMLSVTIELRHAPWLWIKDLASPDPYFILPVAIVVSTFFMQKTMPSPGVDPAQQRMMNVMMPVMLGVFAWSVAAGLGLYWLVGTIIAIIQQNVMNRTELGREMRAVMEKRARKQQVR